MKVAIYGNGRVGSAVRRLLSNEPQYEVLGPYGRSERDEALCSGSDVVLIATTSFMSEIGPDIRSAVLAGSNVITTAEEAAFPWCFDNELAEELDILARSRGVSILGAGLNPGFAFDALVLTLAGVARKVDAIRVERTVDLSGFSTTVLRRLGIGFERAAFREGVLNGAITGHIGFSQSMRIVSRRMGVDLTGIERHIEPLDAHAEYNVSGMVVAPGESAGFHQRYVGIVGDQPWFEAMFLGHVDPKGAGYVTRDEILIRSETPPIRLVIEPGIDPQIGAPRLIVNSFERLLAAPPGWLTVAELPPATPVAKR